MVKVSIVMPVYNCEVYLRESLGSVQRQTLEEWELLCVDDGSTDSSLGILEEFRQQDERIRVFTQSNQGAGVARNLGLQHARGEYSAFLDADDFYFDEDALESMYEMCERNHVGACGSRIKQTRNGVTVTDKALAEVHQLSQDRTVLDYRDFQFDYGYTGFIFNTAVLRAKRVIFPPYRRFEDPPFLAKAMTCIGRFSFIEKFLYCYRMPNVSARFNKVNTLDLLKGLKENLEFAREKDLEKLFLRTLHRLEAEYCSIVCNHVVSDSTEMVELLLEINHFVREALGQAEYVIAPLRKILGSVAEANAYRKEYLMEQILSCKRLFLYGAGVGTTDFLYYLGNQGMAEKVAAIIVTSRDGNPSEIKGIPVMAVNDYQYVNGDWILVTVIGAYWEEIARKLDELQIAAYDFLDVSMV